MDSKKNSVPSDEPLDIIIVGAGVAGLASAIGLRRAGHNITIIEKSSMTNEVGAAIHVCPNASRILIPWGLDPVKSRFVTAKSSLFAKGDTLEPILDLSYVGCDERYGANCFFAHRVDLHDALKKLALGEDGPGRKAELRVGVGAVDYEPESGVVKLSDGSELKGDLIIGADGIHSKAVEHVLGRSVPAVSSGSSCFRFLVPTEYMMSDPETAPLMANGDGRFRAYLNSESDRIVWYPCRDNTIQNMILIYSDTSTSSPLEDWNTSATQEMLLAKMKGFHPAIIAACKKANEIKRWPLLSRQPLPTWHRSRLVVIGDAAHPMLPHQGQGGAQAIEDAAALGTLFTSFHQKSSTSISTRLDVFEKIRRNRASAIQMFSNFGQDQIHKTIEGARMYVEDGKLPRDSAGFEDFNFGPNVIEACNKELLTLAAVA